MKMPNCERAVVDVEKLRDYCLNPGHPRGRHKARVFAASLGLTGADASELRDALHDAACSGSAMPGEVDGYGQRYVVNFTMGTATGRTAIQSAWMVRRGEDFPRLLTCYVI